VWLKVNKEKRREEKRREETHRNREERERETMKKVVLIGYLIPKGDNEATARLPLEFETSDQDSDKVKVDDDSSV